ncbi:hypothetical protein A8C56_17150 [Niabella ginsenosidivorans]|uniref:Uncharacterized protein n=1 Tax=Niabella ginsenosidivorans TaxID=1176587 RepID=A0A1A9I562_9BACT|nr:hypothetical protein A8C56_17150 [Niabella ginsenosidivorans]
MICADLLPGRQTPTVACGSANNRYPVFSFGSSIPSGHWQHLLNDSFNIGALRAFLRLWLFAATDIWLPSSWVFT